MLSRIDIFRKYIEGIDDLKIVYCSRKDLEDINKERQMIVAAANCKHNTIIICEDDTEFFTQEELDVILLHEIVHIKLYDMAISGGENEEELADKLAIGWFTTINKCNTDVAYAVYSSAVNKTKELTIMLRRKYGIPEDRPMNSRYDHRNTI